jgi:hypothetical protein
MDDGAGEFEQCAVVVGVPLVASDEAAEVAEPGQESLDLPATFVAPHRPEILSHDFSIAAIRCDQLEPMDFSEPLVELVAVVRLVADHPRGPPGTRDLPQRFFDERAFRRRGARRRERCMRS